MLTVFLYQVLRLLRDRVLLVWTLGFPIVLSLIFMAMFSNLDKVYEATPMSFGVVQNEAYRTAPGLDAVVERISYLSDAPAADEQGDRRVIPRIMTATTAGPAQASPEDVEQILAQTPEEKQVLAEWREAGLEPSPAAKGGH